MRVSWLRLFSSRPRHPLETRTISSSNKVDLERKEGGFLLRVGISAIGEEGERDARRGLRRASSSP